MIDGKHHLGSVARARRDEVERSADLTGLAQRLQVLLSKVPGHRIYIPHEKALLSRDGGTCAADGARLVFDPTQPDEHRCDVCGAIYAGNRHHRAWIWRYHLWLSERVIHGALLSAIGVAEERNRRWCIEVLEAYATRYSSYPNRDNVLGPTRLFFSTYLESIWLLQLIVAAMILSDGTHSLPDSLGRSLTDMIVESSDLIGLYDEGLSNRQVWNAAALLAAGLFLDDQSRVERGLSGPSGIETLLRHGVSENGRWHEGENYHLFALRGFLLAAELASTVGVNLYHNGARLPHMYTAPLQTMFPDLTLAARGDSPYGVSVQQPRFAELWEIGLARCGDERLIALLARLYASVGEQREIGISEIAEVEQNRGPMQLSRTGLGWKALLWMRGQLPTTEAKNLDTPQSVVIEPDGPVIVRTSDGRYVGLECAGTGLGHGHPDRLHLSLFDREPVLMDFGTGSYVDASLHWYRSWLSHNVPERVGGDGRVGQAHCVAYDHANGWQWCRASLSGWAGGDSTTERSIVVGPEYVVDIVAVNVPQDIVVDLPVHVLGYKIEAARFKPSERIQSSSLGDCEVVGACRTLGEVTRLSSQVVDRGDVFLPSRVGETLFVVDAPGPPPLSFGRADTMPFILRRCAGSGSWIHVFARRPGHVRRVVVDGAEVTIVTEEGRDIVVSSSSGLEVRCRGETIHLSGFRPVDDHRVASVAPPLQRFRCPVFDQPLSARDLEHMIATGHVLDGRNYRRSEETYPGVRQFSAGWCVYAVAQRLIWVVDVRKPEISIRPRNAPDPKLDNEQPDIHSDGVQIYFGDVFDGDDSTGNWRSTWRGYLVVPDASEPTGARVRAVSGLPHKGDEVVASAQVGGDGYRVTVTTELSHVPAPSDALAFGITVNEMYDGRERRAGQLALSGSGWVYLRGDRESPDAASVCRFV